MAFTANSTFSCTVLTANTGMANCAVNFDDWDGHILAPLNVGWTQAEVDAFATTAQAKLIHNTKALRCQLVGSYEDVQDASDDPTESELGNKKRKVFTDEGTSGYMVTIEKGGFEHLLDLRTYNNLTSTYGIIQFDKKGTVAMRYERSDGKYYPLKLDTYFWKIPKHKTPGTPLTYAGTIRLAQGTQLTTDLRAIQTGVDLVDELERVSDIELNDVSSGLASGIFDITAHDHSVNVGGTIGATAAATTVFKAKLKSTGADLAITSVAMTTVGGVPAYKLTLNTSDTDYSATATAVIYWASVSALALVSDSLKYFETNHSNPAFTSGQLEVALT